MKPNDDASTAAIGTSGAGLTLSQGGKTWRLSPLTQSIRNQFVDYLESRARRHVAAFSGDVTDEAFDRLTRRLQRRIDKGYYSFGGKHCQEAIATPSGALEMLRLMLAPDHPGVTDDDAMNLIASNADALKQVLHQAAAQPRK